MEYTYSLAEIREVIDTVLSRAARDNVDQDLAYDSESVSEADLCANCATKVKVEKGEVVALEIEKGVDLDACGVQVVAEAEQQEWSSGDSVGDSASLVLSAADVSVAEMDTAREGGPVSPSHQQLDTEDMSLKVELTYFFYVDEADKVESLDNEINTIKAEVSETDSSEKDSGTGDNLSDNLSDPDIDSLDDEDISWKSSSKSTSFSMMNIFDSVFDSVESLTGSLDFEDSSVGCDGAGGSDSDKDTLDWLSDSSNDQLSCATAEEEMTGPCNTPVKVPCPAARGDNSAVTKGDNTPFANCTLDTTKYYTGSTFSVRECHSEVRHKFFKRMFRKVFPKKKYVVNK